MSKKDLIGIYVSEYFQNYLPSVRGASPQTIASYVNTFQLFQSFLSAKIKIGIEKFPLSQLSAKLIEDFLGWLEAERRNSISTRNCRLACVKSFCKFLLKRKPDLLFVLTEILNIPAKRFPTSTINYLTSDGIKLVIKQVNRETKTGLRDFTILSVMTMTGVRVSELINIRISEVNFSEPECILVHGKGGKSRWIPLPKALVKILDRYFSEFNLYDKRNFSNFLFVNHSGLKFTRQGITYIVSKYADKARRINSSLIPDKISPHSLRHSMAMAMVKNGVDLISIRDILGHASVTTTEIYARAYSKLKRNAVEKTSKNLIPQEMPKWKNKQMLSWLKGLQG